MYSNQTFFGLLSFLQNIYGFYTVDIFHLSLNIFQSFPSLKKLKFQGHFIFSCSKAFFSGIVNSPDDRKKLQVRFFRIFRIFSDSIFHWSKMNSK